MSTPCEEIRPELEALLGAMTDGGLDAPGRKRLAEILHDHPDARQVYLDYCQMHALLRSAHGELSAVARPRRRWAPWAAAAAAAALLAALIPWRAGTGASVDGWSGNRRFRRPVATWASPPGIWFILLFGVLGAWNVVPRKPPSCFAN